MGAHGLVAIVNIAVLGGARYQGQMKILLLPGQLVEAAVEPIDILLLDSVDRTAAGTGGTKQGR